MKYAIIDIETTGGSAFRSRITEIAILIHDGEKVIDRFESLVNASRNIPYKITQLTGISNEMIADAPLFKELADQIDEMTKDCVFVAHNVNFDYAFIKEEYKRLGRSYRRKKLCTVRLSRRLLPNKLSYSLGKLCDSEGIKIKARHRAMGDAEATTILFDRLLKKDEENFIEQSLNPLSLEALLPPHLDKETFISLPEEQGIYYFQDQKKKVVYIGQAKNIKKRVHSHFSGNSNTGAKHFFVKNIYGVHFQLVSSKLLLSLIEAIEIKKHWPRYNRSLKRFKLNYGIFHYEDRNGYHRLTHGKCGKFDQPLKAYRQLDELKEELKDLVTTYELCPRLCGLQPLGSGKCNYIEQINCKGACTMEESADDYNLRFELAIKEQLSHQLSYLIAEKDEKKEQQAVVLVEKGRVKGYAEAIPMDMQLDQLDQLKPQIKAVYDDQDLLWIVDSFHKKSEEQNIIYLS